MAAPKLPVNAGESEELSPLRYARAAPKFNRAPRDHNLSPVASLRRSSSSACPRHAGAGAGEGNRTLVVSLEGFCSTIELHPPAAAIM